MTSFSVEPVVNDSFFSQNSTVTPVSKLDFKFIYISSRSNNGVLFKVYTKQNENNNYTEKTNAIPLSISEPVLAGTAMATRSTKDKIENNLKSLG